LITLEETQQQGKQVLCRLVASKPKSEMYSLNDIKTHVKFVFQTEDGEDVDMDGVKRWPNKWPLHQTYTYKATNYSDAPKPVIIDLYQTRIVCVCWVSRW